MSRCGLIAQREAKRNAPRSPTMRQLSATLKRKKRTIQRRMPGGLEKSISYEVVRDGGGWACSVFVPTNSYAGKYAKRIHDEKGKTWRHRGPGTVAKGARADDKYILRAVRDNADAFRRILEAEAGATLK